MDNCQEMLNRLRDKLNICRHGCTSIDVGCISDILTSFQSYYDYNSCFSDSEKQALCAVETVIDKNIQILASKREPVVSNDSFKVWITSGGPVLAIKTETDGIVCGECWCEVEKQVFNIEYRFSCKIANGREVNTVLSTPFTSEEARDDFYDQITMDMVNRVTGNVDEIIGKDKTR